MSAARYAPLPNPHTDPDAQNEMEAAFLHSDDEDDEDDGDEEHHRLLASATTATRNGYHPLAAADPLAEDTPLTPRAYDFEDMRFDADWAQRPPPGSPPPEAETAAQARASVGNTNGYVPDFGDAAQQFARRARSGGRGARRWLRRVVGMAEEDEAVARPAVGGGTINDGVFANVTAKPSRGIRVQEGDNVYIVPEDSQKDAPPSYASAQADAVPPYWETTIHAPSASTLPGDMVVDSLATGSLFSFLWNMLVSISFQFVGFLLTYLLHTTHAAKLGSRAGLGITLIQYGFAMRSRAEEWAREGAGGGSGGGNGAGGGDVDGWAWQTPGPPLPTFGTAAEAEAYYRGMNATALPSSTPSIPLALAVDTAAPPTFLSDATSEWLSFFLMTVGWFILLTSLLSFWRVKRWERSILSSAPSRSPSSSLPLPTTTSSSSSSSGRSLLGFSPLNIRGLRAGLGFYPGASSSSPNTPTSSTSPRRWRERRAAPRLYDDIFAAAASDEPAGEEMLAPRANYVIPIDVGNPEATSRLARAYVEDARLQRDLRAAGLL